MFFHAWVGVILVTLFETKHVEVECINTCTNNFVVRDGKANAGNTGYVFFEGFGTEPMWYSRKKVEALGNIAASSSLPTTVSKDMLQAARWLENQDLAVLNQRNQLVLTDDALQVATMLSHPVPVKDPIEREHQSLWSLRKQLLKRGWTFADQSSSPSVHERVAHGKSACKMYFTLLLDCSFDFIW